MTREFRVSMMIIVALAIRAVTLNAQTLTPISQPQIGLFGAFQLVQHEIGTSVGVVGLPSCGSFTDGSGTGVAFGTLYQYPIAPRLALQVRGSYSIMTGSLSSREVIGNGVENGRVVDAEVEYSLDPRIGIASVEPRIVWAPFNVPLGIHIGAQAGSVISKTAEQKETLLAPRTATFVGGSAVRNSGSGDFDAADVYAATIAGLEYDIPAGTNMIISPEIAYHFNLNNAGSESAWRGDALRLGVSLKMLLGAPTATDQTGISGIAADVRASGLYADSSEQSVVQVRIEEFLGAQLRPLLNYLFFDDNSSRLPSRYNLISQDDARAFSVENLHHLNAVTTYHQILNIVGRRLTENPGTTIRLVGCNAGAGAERGNARLASERAEWVKGYLQRIWNIDENRISIESRALPEKPSNESDPDGIAENRRVEIYSDDPAILAPVITSDTTRTANPPGLRFRSTASAEAGIARWRLSAGQSGKMLKEFSGTGSVPGILDWHLEEDQNRVPRFPEPIDFSLEVTDAKGKTYATPVASINTDQVTIQRKRRERVADKEINRYSLILFDFGSAEITPDNRRIIDYIRNRITINSTVTVTGYTDRLGDSDFNKRLSEQRAAGTTQALGVGRPVGAGETMLYGNNLPEGRFYCRTVNVVVETPISE